MTRSAFIAWLAYIQDRKLIRVTCIRTAVVFLIAQANIFVAVPTNPNPIPLVLFLPLAIGTLGAISLPERMIWVSSKHTRFRAATLRLATNGVADILCFGLLILLIPAVVAFQNLGGSILLCVAVGYGVSVFSADLAWMAAALAGSLMVVAVGAAHTPIASVVPLWIGVVSYFLLTTIYLTRGPR